jgi:hypothetical protein
MYSAQRDGRIELFPKLEIVSDDKVAGVRKEEQKAILAIQNKDTAHKVSSNLSGNLYVWAPCQSENSRRRTR